MQVRPSKIQNISRKLIFRFGLLIAVFLVFGLFSLYDTRTISGLTRTIYNHPLVVSNAALQSNVSIAKMHRSMKDVVLFKSPDRIQQSIKAVNQQEQHVYKYLDLVRKNILGDEGKELEKEARELFDKWRQIREEVIALVREGEREKAAEITIGKGAVHVSILEEKMRGLTDYARTKATVFMEKADRTHTRLNLFLIVFLFLTISVSTLIAVLTIKSTARAENKLLESENNLRATLDATPFPTAIVDVHDNRIFYWSSSATTLFGHTATTKADWYQIVFPDSEYRREAIDRWKSFLEVARTSGRSINTGEYHITCENSLIRICELYATFLPNNLIVTFNDITERKKAEVALVDVMRFNEKIVAESPVGIAIYEADSGQCIVANDAIANLVGATKEQILQQNFYTTESWKKSGLLTTAQNSLEEDQNKHLITEVKTTFNQELVIDCHFAPLFFKEKKHLLITATDITAREQAEKEIRDQKQIAERYLNLAGVMFIGFDTNGNVNIANQKACKVLECSDTEIIGKNWFDNYIPEYKRADAHKVYERMMNKEIELVEYHENEVISKNNNIKAIAWHNTFIEDDNGKIVGFLGSGEDITEKRKLQAQLLQAQKMESIGNLAGGIAHDFNNILSSIIGFTELSLDDVEDGSELQEHLNEVYAAGNRAKDLVKQILAFARQSEEETKPTRLSDIVFEALKLLRPSTPTTIEIIPVIESNSFTMGNPSQLHQVVMNLCTNSIQALQESGGFLKIGLQNIKPIDDHDMGSREYNTDGYIELSVSDNGPGVDTSIKESIFEPYFTTKGVGKGTGMGLAVVKGIIESYGGEITVTSDPGKETVFAVRLAITPGSDTHEFTRDESVEYGTEHILFVDDEPALILMGCRILESLGYKVTPQTNSFEAFELFKNKPEEFDLVITDMTMPLMTGEDLTKQLRKVRVDIPIILCTGYSNKINDKKAKQIGINAFVDKPYSKSDFAKIVREVLDNSSKSC